MLGRILAYGSTVTTDTNIITVPPILHVVNVVVNGGIGTAISSDFSLSVKKASINVARSPASGSVAPGTLYPLSTGDYVVSGVANPAYTQSFSAECPGGNITLSAGDDKTCTITNTEIIASPATLRVANVVVNGSVGTSISSDFIMYTKKAGVDVVSPTPGVSSPGSSYSLSAGTYVVSENVNSLYTKVFSGDCDSNGSVTLLAGEDKTCTIINTDIPTSSDSGPGFALLPLINVTKIPSPLSLPGGAGSVTFKYLVTNVGGISMHGVWVKDDKCQDVKFISGDVNKDSLLNMDETWTYSCTKILSQTETNTATVHGQANGWDAYDYANATVVVGSPLVPPLIHVMKKPNVFLLPAGGGVATYTYTVTNPGTEPLSNVSITDDKCTGLPGRVVGHPGDLNKNNLLESNESWSFTCVTNITRTTTNIGTAVGYANGMVAVDVSPATVAVSAPGLPNTGFLADTRDIIILALSCSLLLVSVSLSMILKKNKI